MTLWLIFYISDTLGEKEKQMVSTRANDANKYNDWLNFILQTNKQQQQILLKIGK